MEPKEERYIDKSDWPAGEWQDEPDRVEWRAEGTPRLACLIVRTPHTGALCGYVGVPPGHPWHGKDWAKIDAHVHGGLTFANPCDEGGRICHVPLNGETPDVWWVGFDCAHAWDFSPGRGANMRKIANGDATLLAMAAGDDRPEWDASYRDVHYVRNQVDQLAAQAARVAKGLPPTEDEE